METTVVRYPSNPVSDYSWSSASSPVEETDSESSEAAAPTQSLAPALMLMDGLEEKDFICPITGTVIEDPARLGAHAYEREALIQWVREQRTDPLTQELVSVEDIQCAPDIKVQLRHPATQERIAAWRRRPARDLMSVREAAVRRQDIDDVLEGGLLQAQVLQALVHHFSNTRDVAIAYVENGSEQNEAIVQAFQNNPEARYIVCSYDINPTETDPILKHQIAVILDRQEQVIVYVDSLQKDSDLLPQLQALQERFPEFAITNRNETSHYTKQSRSREDRSCCGVYTFLNIRNFVQASAADGTAKINLNGEALQEVIKELLICAQSISVETFLHTLMKQDYAGRCAFLDVPMETDRYPMADLYTNLSLIPETEPETRKATERKLRNQEGHSVTELLRAGQEETKTIELKEIFEPRASRPAEKILLIGRTGVGKTTLCQKILYDWSCESLWPEKFKSIMWIPLRQLNDRVAANASLDPENFRDPEEWLVAVIREVGLPSLPGPVIIDELRTYLTHHRSKILILLDGYDEANPTVAEMVKRLIMADRGHVQPLHLIITTRPGDLAGIHACTDTHVESIGFSEEQSKLYITRFFSEHAKRSGNRDLTPDFLRVLEENHMLKGLSNVPLQLQMMCSLYEKRPQAFGTNMTSLYAEMMNAFWEWSVSKEIGTIEQKERVLQALGAIAAGGLSSGQVAIPGTSITALMKPFRDVPMKTVLGCGVIKAQGNIRAPNYTFLHLSFQGYLTASYVVRQGMPAVCSYIRKNKRDSQFNLVLPFMAGLLATKSDALRETKAFFDCLNEKPVNLRQEEQDLLVLQCLNECSNLPELIDEVNEGMGNVLDRTARAIVCDSTIRHIQESEILLLRAITSHKLFLSILFEALRDPNRIVGARAARALIKLGSSNPIVVEGLLAALRDPEVLVITFASATLIQLGSSTPGVVEGLLATLRDPEKVAREYACGALILLESPSPEVVEGLLAALRDPEKDVINLALKGLIDLGTTNPVVVEGLLAALRDTDHAVRGIASKALIQLGSSNPIVVEGLLVTLRDPDALVRAFASAVLIRLESLNPVVVEGLLAALRDREKDVRESAAKALSQLETSNPVVVEGLLAALRDTNDNVKSIASKRLVELGSSNPIVVERLLALLQDPEILVKAYASATLIKLGSSNPVVEGLLAALRDPDEIVREFASESLTELGTSNPLVVEGLLAALRDPGEGAVKFALEALIKLGSSSLEVVSGLLAALRDTQETARTCAAEALRILGSTNPVVVEGLLVALSEPETVRTCAAMALKNLGNASPVVVERLLAALKDPEYNVKIGAAAALTQLKSLRTVVLEGLLAASRDPDSSVSVVANAALEILRESNPDS